MMKLRGKFDSFIAKASPLMLVFIFMVIGFIQYIFYHQDMDLHREELESIDHMKEDMEWTLFISTYNTIQQAANEKADHNAINIVAGLQQEYPNLDLLKRQFDRGQILETKLPYTIFKSLNRSQLFGIANGNNDAFVITRDRYVFEGSAVRYGRVWHTYDEDRTIDFDRLYAILENYVNVTDDSILVSYPTNDEKDEFKNIVEVTDVVDLKKHFDEKGIDGFRDYIFFGRAYITENGDVFGTPDISPETSFKTNNHKMIVVQKFSLYDLIRYHHGREIEMNRHHFDQMKKRLDQVIVMRSLSYIAFMTLDLVSMIVIIFCVSIGKASDSDEV
jgi:hypothetical protein